MGSLTVSIRHRPRTVRAAVLSLAAALATALAAAVAGPASAVPAAAAFPPIPRVTVTDTVATRLEVPWGLSFMPGGKALIAERKGNVWFLWRGHAPRLVGTVPGVVAKGEGGLLGLQLSRDGKNLFAYLSTATDNRVVRMTFDGARLGAPRPILTGIPVGTIHNGGRLALGPDNTLWIGTGEVGLRDPAQDRRNLGGKILHINVDGTIPATNPWPGSPVWSLGHRNVQGLAFDSAGRLWASELGQNTYDELNLIVKGGNYGWPEVEGTPAPGTGEGFVPPKRTWPTSEASPSGLAIAGGVAYMAALRGQRLWAIPLSGTSTGTPRALFPGAFGRLRTVQVAPDGALWLTTSNRDGRATPAAGDDRVLRVQLGG